MFAESHAARHCKLGFEGIVSKRVGSPYVSGRSRHWIKTQSTGGEAGGGTGCSLRQSLGSASVLAALQHVLDGAFGLRELLCIAGAQHQIRWQR
jgi:hypothetical protein